MESGVSFVTPGSRRFGSCLLLVLLAALVLLLMACSEPQMALSPTREVAREGEAGVLAAIEQSFRIDPAWVITRAPSGPFDGPSFMAEPDPDSGNRMIVSPIANASLPAGYTPDQWVEERIQAGLDAAETAQDATLSPQAPLTIGTLEGFTVELNGFHGAGTGQPLEARFDAVFGSDFAFVFYVENELDDRNWMRWQFSTLTDSVDLDITDGSTPQTPAKPVVDRAQVDEAFEMARATFSEVYGEPVSAPGDATWHRHGETDCEDRYLRWEIGSVHDAVPALDQHVLDMRTRGFAVDRRSSSLDAAGFDYLAVATSEDFQLTAYGLDAPATKAWIDWLEQNAGAAHGLAASDHGWFELQVVPTASC